MPRPPVFRRPMLSPATVAGSLPTDQAALTQQLNQWVVDHAKNVPPGHEDPTSAIALAQARTALHQLLNAGADVNGANAQGRTALHRAVWNNALPLVDLLLEHGADPNRRDREGATPVFDALAPGNNHRVPSLPMLERLIAARANLDLVRWNGWAAFSLENFGKDDLLLGDGHWLNEVANGQPLDPLKLPPSPQDTPGVPVPDEIYRVIDRTLRSAFNSGRVQRQSPLLSAVEADQTAVVQRLLDAGADPLQPVKFGPTTTLLHAVSNSTSPELLDLLMGLGLSTSALDSDGHTPVQALIARGQTMGARALEGRMLRALADAESLSPGHARARARL